MGKIDKVLMSDTIKDLADKVNKSIDKVNGIEENANNYKHPETHSVDMLIETKYKQFVSEEDKKRWEKIAPSVEELNSKIDALSGASGTNEKANKAEFDTLKGDFHEHTSANITSHNVSRGVSNFAGSGQEVTIPHGLPVVPVSAYAFPMINPEGYLGEVWIRMDKTNLYIGNSGSFTGVMSWTAIG